MHLKNKYIVTITALVLVISLGIGCLDESEVKPVTLEPGQLDSYEFNLSRENFSNSSTYMLFKNGTVNVVTSVNNSTKIDIIIPESVSAEIKTAKGPGIKNLVMIGNYSNNLTNYSKFEVIPNTSFVSTFTRSRDKKKVHIEISQLMTGFVAYSYDWEYGQFYHIPSRNETLIIVLPSGHDTGNIILGSPRPNPDIRLKDSRGRVNLIWENPNQGYQFVQVKYYRSSLPSIMSNLVVLMIAAFFITYIYYKNQIRKLQQKRNNIESNMKKRK